jgi:hypothetical protein
VKNVAVGFVVGVVAGAVGIYVARRIQVAIADDDLDTLADKLSATLGTLENRLVDVTKAVTG